MKQVKHTLYVGLNDKDTLKQVITKAQAEKIVMDIVGDCTISDAKGCYTHNNGTKTHEKTLRVELFSKADNEVNSYCVQLKKALNQECIALQKEYITTKFI